MHHLNYYFLLSKMFVKKKKEKEKKKIYIYIYGQSLSQAALGINNVQRHKQSVSAEILSLDTNCVLSCKRNVKHKTMKNRLYVYINF